MSYMLSYYHLHKLDGTVCVCVVFFFQTKLLQEKWFKKNERKKFLIPCSATLKTTRQDFPKNFSD